jgi:N-acetylglucosamine-6-sulfatase
MIPCAVATSASAQVLPQRPNILLVMTDDQTVESMRVMPAVQRLLADRGTTFDNSFVNYSLCCPSRATALTGQYSHNHHVQGLHPPLGGYTKLNTSNYLPLWLQQAGYLTMHLGKFLNGYGSQNPDPREVPAGWDVWQASIDPTTYDYDHFTLNENGTLVDYGGPDDAAVYQTDFYTDRAIELIDRYAGSSKPFFFSLAYLAPHHGAPLEFDDPPVLKTPAVALRHQNAFANQLLPMPQSFAEADVSDKPGFVRRRSLFAPDRIASIQEAYQQRLESLLAVDEGVQRIVSELERTGELENTLIVFTSDNGLAWGEHRWRGGKRVPYEESIRVPFVVRYDRLVATARTDARPVLNIDLAPTFAALAGAWAPGAEGRSFLPLLAGGRVPWRTRFLVEHLRRNPPTYCALRAPRYSFVTYATGERELYDLVRDPYQLTNVAGRPASRRTVAVLRKQLARLCKPPPPGLPRHLLCTRKGTGSADVLRGTNGYDILCGGRGNDRLYPRKGKDWVYAGPGRDVIGARDGFADVISCGKGHDVVRVDSRDRARNDCERVKRG